MEKNGAGKSTLAKAICQFITPEGDIRYRGQSIMMESIKERAEKNRLCSSKSKSDD